MTANTTNTRKLPAARPSKTCESSYTALLHTGATIKIPPGSLDSMSIAELEAPFDPLRSVDAVITALFWQPRFVDSEMSLNHIYDVFDMASDLSFGLKQVDARGIESIRSSPSMEEHKRAWLVLEYQALARDSLMHFAANSAPPAADTGREAVQ